MAPLHENLHGIRKATFIKLKFRRKSTAKKKSKTPPSEAVLSAAAAAAPISSYVSASTPAGAASSALPMDWVSSHGLLDFSLPLSAPASPKTPLSHFLADPIPPPTPASSSVCTFPSTPASPDQVPVHSPALSLSVAQFLTPPPSSPLSAAGSWMLPNVSGVASSLDDASASANASAGTSLIQVQGQGQGQGQAQNQASLFFPDAIPVALAPYSAPALTEFPSSLQGVGVACSSRLPRPISNADPLSTRALDDELGLCGAGKTDIPAATYSDTPTLDEWWAAVLRRVTPRAQPYNLRHTASARPISGDRAMAVLAGELARFQCQVCGGAYNVTIDDVVRKIRGMIQNAGDITTGFVCPHCAAANCIGCGSSVVINLRSSGVSVDAHSLVWCCGVGRLFLIWALCCGPIVDLEPFPPPKLLAPVTEQRKSRLFFKLPSKPPKQSTAGTASGSSNALHTTLSHGSSSSSSVSVASGISGTSSKKSVASGNSGDKSAGGKKSWSKSSKGHSSSKAIPSGVGYGAGGWNGPKKSDQAKAKETQGRPFSKADDDVYRSYFLAIARLLSSSFFSTLFRPISSAESSLVCEIIARSSLMVKAAELLQNTSLEDITKRVGLYEALVEMFTSLLEQPSLTRVVLLPRTLFAREDQIHHVCFPKRPCSGDSDVSVGGVEGAGGVERVERVSSSSHTSQADSQNAMTEVDGAERDDREQSEALIGLLKRMAGMCERVLKQASIHQDDFTVGDGPKMLEICRKISQLSASYDTKYFPQGSFRQKNGMAYGGQAGNASSSSTATTARVTTRLSDERERAKKAVTWHRENCVADCDDDVIIRSHFFQANILSVGACYKGRMKRLINEINMLRESLPEGIYLRHATSRLDVMKFTIAGPKGTPYENGLFEFDLFCPSTYPQSPPLVRLKTTGHGHVRFNPNLYSDGTVCLSLIGTWGNGQTWHAEHSTILQVVVSIQAMIFCEEPYYNEPGRESHKDPSASAAENRFLQGHTIEHAMVYWLDRLVRTAANSSKSGKPEDMIIWEDVVKNHFSFNGRDILQTASRWDGKRMIKELASLLQRQAFLGVPAI